MWFFTHFLHIFNAFVIEISFPSIGLHDVCARSFSVSLAHSYAVQYIDFRAATTAAGSFIAGEKLIQAYPTIINWALQQT